VCTETMEGSVKIWRNSIQGSRLSFWDTSTATLTCRFIYNTILENKIHTQTYLDNTFEATISTKLNWKKKIFGQIMNITIYKLRSFQYKYIMHIHDIVTNNKKHFKYGLIELSLCDVCSATSESNIYFFWECPNV